MHLREYFKGKKVSNPSIWAIVLIVIVFFSADMIHQKWKMDQPPNRAVIKHDVIGYYGYLPAIFIYGDYKLDFISTPGFKNENKFQYIRLDGGKRLIQYTSGLSILYSPFFLTAHALAPLFGQERDGYNWVYQLFLVLSALFYVTIGLLILRKLLLKHFNELVTTAVLLLIAFGTNLFYYTVYEGPMSHSYSFAFIAIFLYLVDKWYIKPDIGRTILLGLTYGMVVLIRPTNALVLILLLFWNVNGLDELKERFLFLIKRIPLILLMIFFFIIPWIPQLLYWKSVAGHFFYNSYEKVGSAFYFNAPQTLQMLFSYRKGWFIYTPLMLFAFTGFYFLFRQHKKLFIASALYMIAMIYVMSSWWAWWFGGGFGTRSMIDTYAIMAFPLAAIMERVFREKRILARYSILVLLILLLGLQWLQTAQYNHVSIHHVAMDKDAYWHKYFKVIHRGAWPYLSDPDHQLARLGIYYYYDWDENYDGFRELGEDRGRSLISSELSSNKKMMRSIHRHAKRNEISDEEALDMVVDRIFEKKTERENFR